MSSCTCLQCNIRTGLQKTHSRDFCTAFLSFPLFVLISKCCDFFHCAYLLFLGKWLLAPLHPQFTCPDKACTAMRQNSAGNQQNWLQWMRPRAVTTFFSHHHPSSCRYGSGSLPGLAASLFHSHLCRALVPLSFGCRTCKRLSSLQSFRTPAFLQYKPFASDQKLLLLCCIFAQ